MPDRPYIFHDLTLGLCSKCLRKVEAKIIEQDGQIFMTKWCPEHRFQEDDMGKTGRKRRARKKKGANHGKRPNA